MEFNLTLTIEKLLNDLIGGKWGRLTAKLYLKYHSILNFRIVIGIGTLISMLTSNIGGMFGSIISFLSGFIWNYTMTIGPLGHLWGFGVKYETKKDVELDNIEEDEEE